MYYKTLFTPFTIGNREAPNRIVSQAMEGNDGCPGGSVSERTLNRYKKLAKGEWGIVIVEATSITSESLARKNGLILIRENLESFKKLVKEFKRINPNGLILFQISHSGYKSGPFSRKTTICPGVKDADYLKTEEIDEIKRAFVESVLLTEEAGADGCDIKMCHGYFGSEMLRPGNVREDMWGGSFENRTRFLREVMSEIKERLKNSNFIIGSRVSFYEGIRGGCGTVEADQIIEDTTEMDQVIRLMDQLGMDYVNVSAGIPGVTSELTRPTKPSKYLYLHLARYAKHVKELGTSLAVIGSGYTILEKEAAAFADENIGKDYVDFAGFGRMSFSDPLYPSKLQTGEEIHYCTACSGCSRLMIRQVNDGCILFNDYYKELHRTSK
jgi:2,4-dienoyl-CoA reductase-like NADH-dependent reductase (Old Yellow Enzyme family)